MRRPAFQSLRATVAHYVLHLDAPPEEQRRFEAWARAGIARALVGISILLCAFIVLLWPLDRVVFHDPAILAAYDVWRPVTFCLVAGAALLATFVPFARRHAYAVSLGVAGLAMGFSAYTFSAFGGLQGPFGYLGYDFLFMLVPVLVSLGARFGGSLWLAGCFVAGALWRLPDQVHDRFFGFFLLLGGLAVFANTVFGHMVYHLAWRNFLQRRALERQKVALSEAHQKSERLLLNILPASIADRLRDAPGAIADRFADVTVLFADICAFTPLAESLSPEALVELLNQLFSAFDGLVERHGVEKIKTIGDAYMVVGGLPTPRPDHAAAIANLALDMAASAERFRAPDGRTVQLRIGIHTGPAVAGVIGLKKFSYDLWGDTVNTASRMESHGVPGSITVSRATRERLGAAFEFHDRGVQSVKGKGEMQLFLLTGRSAVTPAA